MIKIFKRSPFLLCALLLLMTFPLQVQAQEKCGTVLYEQHRKQQSPAYEDTHQFEEWLRSARPKTNALIRSQSATEEEVYVIPVVVHVVHRGENEGVETNIPESQILEQIRILNEDFRRANEDANRTRAVFRNVAADAKIEFMLALRDPDGMPTNGIVRVKGEKNSYSLSDNVELKSYSYWPAEDYLNIWVAPLQGNLLGYAQFPVSNLEGLSESSNNRLTDGIVVTFNYFGMGGNAAAGSRGRTATHEIGHFLGLRHIWGDGGCDADDFCDDTPTAEKENTGCPSGAVMSCGNEVMYQNYMDYTTDVCMNLFTNCQKWRMRTVLENSPRRNSLLKSPAKIAPVTVKNDASIKAILSPAKGECSAQFTPSVNILNLGENHIHHIRLQMKVDGGILQTLDLEVSIPSLEEAVITFSPLTLTRNLNYDIEFEVLQVNETDDDNPFNNIRNRTFTIFNNASLPLKENFESLPLKWNVQNPDGLYTWQTSMAPYSASDNKAAFINFYDYEVALGEQDYLISPALNLKHYTSAELKFRVAYARYQGNNHTEGLMVAVSTDCGNTFSDYHYSKFGKDLETAPPTTNRFVPEGRHQWREESIDLSMYAGVENLQIAFISLNGYGNNLYVGEVEITGERNFDLDLELEEILSPNYISCLNNPNPSVEIKNSGNEDIHSFDISCFVNSQFVGSKSYDNLDLKPDEKIMLSLEPLSLNKGQHHIEFRIDAVNGKADDNPDNDILRKVFYINDDRDIIPYRLRISKEDADIKWLSINPGNNTGWEITSTHGAKPGASGSNYSFYMNHYNYKEKGEKNWLVSPILDFSKASEASMSFFVSYATFSAKSDGLKVLVSTDCGESFEEIVYSKFGTEITSATSNAPWKPLDAGSWKKQFIDLSDYAGEPDVRIAFESVNDNGNNLYIDHIEFFITKDELPEPQVENDFLIYPNPATDGKEFKVVFNLKERKNLRISIFDSMGKGVRTQDFENVLNQTYIFEMPELRAGIYLVSVSGENYKSVQKVVIR